MLALFTSGSGSGPPRSRHRAQVAPRSLAPLGALALMLVAGVSGRGMPWPVDTFSPVRLAGASTPPVDPAPSEREDPDPARRYAFGVVGDWGYTPEERRRLPQLVDAMNTAGLAFSIHDGDIKNGPPPCTDATYAETLRLFDRFTHPLVYTPGDNEWTDCWRSGGEPLDRLAAIRRVFFADDRSRGRTRMRLARQNARFPENARWSRAGVTFATVHIVGSNNGLPDAERPGSPPEMAERTSAALEWVRATFAAARAAGSAGVALVIHGDPLFDRPPGQRYGYDWFLEGVEREVTAFARPVLFVHGDTHTYRLDRPWLTYAQPRRRLANLTRVESFGPEDLAYVRVTVDSGAPAVFSVTPVHVAPRP